MRTTSFDTNKSQVFFRATNNLITTHDYYCYIFVCPVHFCYDIDFSNPLLVYIPVVGVFVFVCVYVRNFLYSR